MEPRHPLTSQQRLRLWLRCLIRLLLVLLALWAAFRWLPPLVSLLLPFLLALFAAWLLNPLIRLFQKRLKFSRPVGALLSVLLTFGLIGSAATTLIYFIAREVWNLAESWQALLEQLTDTLEHMNVSFHTLFTTLPPEIEQLANSLLQQLLDWLRTAVPDFFADLANRAGSAAMGAPAVLVGVTVFLLGTYFLSADWPSLKRRCAERLTQDGKARLAALRTVTLTAFGGYLRSELLLSLGVFCLLALGFVLLRQPYALLLAALLAVLDFIPIVGSGTAMIPWAIIAFCMGSYQSGIAIFLLWVVVALFRQFAEPKILGGQTGLSPILSLLAVYVGMRLYGVAGMILAPVLCLVARNLLSSGAADGLIRDAKLLFYDLAGLWESHS